MKGASLAASAFLLLAEMYFFMAARDDPLRSFRAAMASSTRGDRRVSGCYIVLLRLGSLLGRGGCSCNGVGHERFFCLFFCFFV